MSLAILTMVYIVTKYTPEKIIQRIHSKLYRHNTKLQKLAIMNFIFIAIIAIYLSISLGSDASITISILDTTSTINLRQTIQFLTIFIVIGTLGMIRNSFTNNE